ncbi:hypothetical protein M5K25_027586 [Dendrobium thyrsiflorum]|uniref:Uncharacterized protein n=1 Tax=Dendrobium thyrsiflorum TaxID=117978 RepID=A0ABD0TU68_DENTH
MSQIKATAEDRISSVENKVSDLHKMMKKILENQIQKAASETKGPMGRTTNSEFRWRKNDVEIMEEMLRRLLEMQTKTSLVVPMANHNQDLTGILLAESTGREIGQEEFDEGSFFHQEPPHIALIRGGSGCLDEGTTKMKSFGGGSRAVDHNERHCGQGEPLIREGGGQEPHPKAPIRGGIGLADGGTAGRAFHGEGGGVIDPYERSFGQRKWTTEGGGWAEPGKLGIVQEKAKIHTCRMSAAAPTFFVRRSVGIYSTQAPNSDIAMLAALKFWEDQRRGGAVVSAATPEHGTTALESREFERRSADHHNAATPNYTFKR